MPADMTPEEMRDEIERLRHGIRIFTDAYEAACAARPQARKPPIEAWLAEHRRREGVRVQQEDRAKAEQVQLRTCDGRWGDT